MFHLAYHDNGFDVSFSATLDHVDRVVEETKKFLVANHMSAHMFDVTLVLREGLLNAVLDGNQLDEEMPVEFCMSLDHDTLVMEISDEGAGFDCQYHMGDIPTPAADSGRGLAIMEHYCDSVRFNDVGNKVTLTIKLRP